MNAASALKLPLARVTNACWLCPRFCSTVVCLHQIRRRLSQVPKLDSKATYVNTLNVSYWSQARKEAQPIYQVLSESGEATKDEPEVGNWVSVHHAKLLQLA